MENEWVSSVGASSFVILMAAVAIVYTLPSTMTPLGSPYGSQPNSCLVEVPNNATLNPGDNLTAVGVTVKFANETQKFYPEGSCPQPAQPQVYALALGVEKDSKFVQADQGKQFALEIAIMTGQEIFNGTSHDELIFGSFNDYFYYPCDHSFIARYEVGQIQAFIPVMPDGTLNINGTTLGVLGERQLNIWSCPDVITTSR